LDDLEGHSQPARSAILATAGLLIPLLLCFALSEAEANSAPKLYLGIVCMHVYTL